MPSEGSKAAPSLPLFLAEALARFSASPWQPPLLLSKPISGPFYRRPALILMDEGTAHLDEDLQRQVFDNLMATGATIIAVTHDERVLARADRRIRLSDRLTSTQGTQTGL
ncbi:MAG: hypothetical protein OXE83_03125 [Gammaproteobacteria bacterium]|nr:hypothetical protein [Gammaproteobacteria bacterium]